VRVAWTVCAVEPAPTRVWPVHKLELATMHMPRVKVRVKIVDDDFDDVAMLD
jgi:hypothetical protein